MIGVDDDHMERAVERVAELGGGWAVLDDEGEFVTFPTPIGARCADRSVSEAAAGFAEIEDALRSVGVELSNPPLALQSLSFAGVPALRMGFSGYLDVLGREVVGLVPEAE